MVKELLEHREKIITLAFEKFTIDMLVFFVRIALETMLSRYQTYKLSLRVIDMLN